MCACYKHFMLKLCTLFDNSVDIFVVCMEVKITTKYEGRNIRWTLGPCSSATEYEDFATYLERCCVPEGRNTLTCYNPVKETGWNKGYIEIQGHIYCNDLWSYQSMQLIEVRGEKIHTFSYFTINNTLIASIYHKYDYYIA